MKKTNLKNTLYILDSTNKFNKQLKMIAKQGKDIEKLILIVEKLANGVELEEKFKDHNLINYKKHKNACECHIELDWLLIYEIRDKDLILLLLETGIHSELFD